MLNGTEKKQLRAMGQSLPALVQIGKDNLTEFVLKNVEVQLEAHELVKVRLLQSAQVPVRQAALDCAAQTRAQVVQIIGRTFLLYRKSKKNKLGIKG